jgi:hypothetical protein
MNTTINTVNLSDVAALIRSDWKNISPYAADYLDAMSRLNSIHDTYYYDTAAGVVMYFLANAAGWRGDVAKTTKAQLKQLLKENN